MSNRQALIIEDNSPIADIFSRTLQLAGFNTEVCSDGATALTRLTGAVPDCVILDTHLPNVSGKTILDQMRMDERWAKARVIVTSGDPHMAQTVSGLYDAILPKPASPRILLGLVAGI